MKKEGRETIAKNMEKPKYDKLDAKTMAFLRSKPWWSGDYHERLQKYVNEEFPDTYIVAFPDRSTLIEELFTQAIDVPTESEIIYIEGKSRGCHDNCLELLAKKKIDTWMCGYALSEDARWRHHSWGLIGDKIVETTVPRIAYLGKVMAKRNLR